ncbi:hypothetical protein PSPO01_14643 [Paraphaeosphaeria sporulosa]
MTIPATTTASYLPSDAYNRNKPHCLAAGTAFFGISPTRRRVIDAELEAAERLGCMLGYYSVCEDVLVVRRRRNGVAGSTGVLCLAVLVGERSVKGGRNGGRGSARDGAALAGQRVGLRAGLSAACTRIAAHVECVQIARHRSERPRPATGSKGQAGRSVGVLSPGVRQWRAATRAIKGPVARPEAGFSSLAAVVRGRTKRTRCGQAWRNAADKGALRGVLGEATRETVVEDGRGERTKSTPKSRRRRKSTAVSCCAHKRWALPVALWNLACLQALHWRHWRRLLGTLINNYRAFASLGAARRACPRRRLPSQRSCALEPATRTLPFRARFTLPSPCLAAVPRNTRVCEVLRTATISGPVPVPLCAVATLVVAVVRLRILTPHPPGIPFLVQLGHSTPLTWHSPSLNLF